jgi:hypothetical protein
MFLGGSVEGLPPSHPCLGLDLYPCIKRAFAEFRLSSEPEFMHPKLEYTKNPIKVL